VRQRIDEGSAEDAFVAKARVYVAMVDNPGTLPDPAPHLPDPNDLDNPTNRPGRCVHLFAHGLEVSVWVLQMAVVRLLLAAACFLQSGFAGVAARTYGMRSSKSSPDHLAEVMQLGLGSGS
jgi:hypothetical protein